MKLVTHRQRASERRPFGTEIERRTARFLSSQAGWTLLATNYRAAGAEIDLVYLERIGLSRRELVFVEVRYRYDRAVIQAIESITPLKQRRIERAASVFITRERVRADTIRFDVVAWIGERPVHVRHAWVS